MGQHVGVDSRWVDCGWVDCGWVDFGRVDFGRVDSGGRFWEGRFWEGRFWVGRFWEGRFWEEYLLSRDIYLLGYVNGQIESKYISAPAAILPDLLSYLSECR